MYGELFPLSSTTDDTKLNKRTVIVVSCASENLQLNCSAGSEKSLRDRVRYSVNEFGI